MHKENELPPSQLRLNTVESHHYSEPHSIQTNKDYIPQRAPRHPVVGIIQPQKHNPETPPITTSTSSKKGHYRKSSNTLQVKRNSSRNISISLDQPQIETGNSFRRATFLFISRYFTPDKQYQYYQVSLKKTVFNNLPEFLQSLIVSYAVSTFDYWKAHALRTLEDHWKSVLYLIALPNNGYLVSACRDSTIKVWDTDEGKCLHTLLGHSKAVNCLLFLPNGLLASGSDDGSMRLWDLTTQEWTTKMEHSAPVVSITTLGHAPFRILSNDFWIFTAAAGKIFQWDALSSKPLRTIDTCFAAKSNSPLLCLSIVENFLISLNKDYRIEIRDVEPLLQSSKASPQLKHSIIATEVENEDENKFLELKPLLSKRFKPIIPVPLNVILSLENNTVAVAMGFKIRILDFTNATILRVLSGHTGNVLALTLLDNGYLVSASSDCTIRIWDHNTGELVRIIGEEENIHNEPIRSLAVLDNGWLVSGSDDKNIKFWGNVYPGSTEDITPPVRKISLSAFPDDDVNLISTNTNSNVSNNISNTVINPNLSPTKPNHPRSGSSMGKIELGDST